MNPAVEVMDLSFRYPGNACAVVQDLNFQVSPGEIFGFLGPSGAGKSTTQKILIGILKGYEGHVRVLGQEARKAGSGYYEKIGVAFEFPNFYSRFTALENLMLFGSLYTGKTSDPLELLHQVDLSFAANKKVGEFSKGMKMRLNFVRALLNKPDVLFLDEPTSGLDPVNAKRMKELILAKKKEGAAILITTHNMNVAEELCDRVAFIVDGHISLIDSPRDLKLKYGSRTVKVEYTSSSGLRVERFRLDALGDNARFLELIRKERIETLHSQEASLEQIFIEVTGRKLNEAVEGAG